MTKTYKTLYLEALKKIEELHALLEASPDQAVREAYRRSEVVDLAGIARHLKVARYTPQQWRQRGHLPPVDFPLIKEPLWYASTIREQFAAPTRRVWHVWPEEVEELSPAA